MYYTLSCPTLNKDFNNNNNNNNNNNDNFPDTRKYWIDVQWESHLMGEGILFSLGWQSFKRWCLNKNTGVEAP